MIDIGLLLFFETKLLGKTRILKNEIANVHGNRVWQLSSYDCERAYSYNGLHRSLFRDKSSNLYQYI